ncbi:alpha/beta fold hydrolase [Mycobacterium sp. EPa45]|uniref:alpha/beta fold hydrolase n=1 Tax=Mycobacterium sp. EPa45 TaxID=1545728 RepID=UPI000641AD3E|nr:alpha/beta hydrolase [Mycobacterium sp. EPa45]AKK25446.1 alpha/beta hydrolase [Mycobacterium sp. EPa45]
MRKGTPPFRGPTGDVVPGSIARAGYLRLGGIDQWVMVRGRSTANPVLVLLHGGPGFSETRFFRYFNAALEDKFTVVYWDQRGAARSYHRGIPASTMTVAQFIADLDELVDIVGQRVDVKRVVIFGHSWGSVLGPLYAARYPDKVTAYVGCGQIGDWAAAEAESYSFALGEARRRDDRRALRTLSRIGPPPYDASAVFRERTCLQRIEGQFRPRELREMGRVMLGTPEAGILDIPKIIVGFRFSMNAMWTEVSQIDLRQCVPVLAMPVFLLLGRHDRWVPPDTSVAYFDALEAPAKELIWFENSGHEPFVDEPAAFNQVMTEQVRRAVGDR